MVYDKADHVIEDFFFFFLSLLSMYQIGLETSMRGSDFISDSVYLLHCKFHKVNSKYGGSYIDSPDWKKDKKTNYKSHR